MEHLVRTVHRTLLFQLWRLRSEPNQGLTCAPYRISLRGFLVGYDYKAIPYGEVTLSLHEPYVVYRLSIIMSESADYWNRMMRENDMDCDATLDAIQGYPSDDDENNCCPTCGERDREQITETICEWCITEEQQRKIDEEDE